jgi:hypothetical protein
MSQQGRGRGNLWSGQAASKVVARTGAEPTHDSTRHCKMTKHWRCKCKSGPSKPAHNETNEGGCRVCPGEGDAAAVLRVGGRLARVFGPQPESRTRKMDGTCSAFGGASSTCAEGWPGAWHLRTSLGCVQEPRARVCRRAPEQRAGTCVKSECTSEWTSEKKLRSSPRRSRTSSLAGPTTPMQAAEEAAMAVSNACKWANAAAARGEKRTVIGPRMLLLNLSTSWLTRVRSCASYTQDAAQATYVARPHSEARDVARCACSGSVAQRIGSLAEGSVVQRSVATLTSTSSVASARRSSWGTALSKYGSTVSPSVSTMRCSKTSTFARTSFTAPKAAIAIRAACVAREKISRSGVDSRDKAVHPLETTATAEIWKAASAAPSSKSSARGARPSKLWLSALLLTIVCFERASSRSTGRWSSNNNCS